jgi:hypothetical protein
MALQNTRSWQTAKRSIGEHVDIGDARLNVEKGHRIVATDKVGDQKSGPGAAGPSVRNQENVVWENGQPSACTHPPRRNSGHLS